MQSSGESEARRDKGDKPGEARVMVSWFRCHLDMGNYATWYMWACADHFGLQLFRPYTMFPIL